MEASTIIEENLIPRPVIVIEPMMIPAAAQAAATSTAPIAPSSRPSRISFPTAFSDSFRMRHMKKAVAIVAMIAQKTARSGEKSCVRKVISRKMEKRWCQPEEKAVPIFGSSFRGRPTRPRDTARKWTCMNVEKKARVAGMAAAMQTL